MNSVNPLDVDQSGRVVALDVLLIVNDINARGSRQLESRPPNSTEPLLDVNGDGGVSPQDVLAIVNALNRFNMPMTINVGTSPAGERVILPSGLVRTNVVYAGETLPESKVVLEQLDTTVSPINLETTANARGEFTFQFDISGAALNLRFTATDKLGRVQVQNVSLPATDAASPELLARIAAQVMPAVGQTAPPVELPDQNGSTLNLNTLIGQKKVVLYFYPKSNTPGCTTEAQDFRDRKAEIEALGATVVGVSLDTVAEQKAFSDRYNINFPLLADPAQETAVDYGVLGEFSGAAIARRTTFIIGLDGKIERIFTNVQVLTHVQEVIAALAPPATN